MSIIKNVALALGGLLIGVVLTLSLSHEVDLLAKHVGEYRELSAPLVLKGIGRSDLVLPAGAAVRVDKLYREEAAISLRIVGDIREVEAAMEQGLVLQDGRYWLQANN